MAKECYFTMNVYGKEENLKEFRSIMESIHPDGLHMKRVYDVYSSELESKDGIDFINIEGCCSYSIDTSMLDDEDSDYREWASEDPKLTNIEIESKRLNLKIVAYSEEQINEEEEYVVVNAGEIEKYELRKVQMYYDEEIGDYIKKGGFGVI